MSSPLLIHLERGNWTVRASFKRWQYCNRFMMPSKIFPLNGASRPDGCGQIHLYQSCCLSCGSESSMGSMRGRVSPLLHGPGLHQSAITAYRRVNVMLLHSPEVQVEDDVVFLATELLFSGRKYWNTFIQELFQCNTEVFLFLPHISTPLYCMNNVVDIMYICINKYYTFYAITSFIRLLLLNKCKINKKTKTSQEYIMWKILALLC